MSPLHSNSLVACLERERKISQKRLIREMMVVEGFLDVSPEAEANGAWEGASHDIYCVVIARIGKELLPRFGYC